MDKNKIIEDIKHQLGYSKLLIKMMMEKGVDRNKVPDEFFDDAIRSYKKITRLLNKLK